MSATAFDRARAPEPSPPREFHFPTLHRETLDNGLRVIVARRSAAPLVSARLVIGAGGDCDAPERSGLACLATDLLDEGAGSRTTVELAEEVARLGAFLGSGADWDASYVWLDLLGEHVARGFDLLADVVMHPRFDPAEFERIRDDQLTSILQQRDQPAAIAGKWLVRCLYGASRYGIQLIGDEDTVGAMALGDLESFYRRNFVPAEASVIVTGAIDPSEAFSMVERRFGGWRLPGKADRPVPQQGEIGSTRVLMVDRRGSVQSEIRVGHDGLPRGSEDYFPVVVMNSLLGEIFNSRIMLNLREKNGFTYGARSRFAFRRLGGPFSVATAVRNEVTASAVKEIMIELERIRSGDVSAEELEGTRNFLMGVFPSTVQTANDLANRIQEMELYDLPQDYFDRYRERIAAVTADDVTRVARSSIHPDRAAIVVVGEAAEVRDSLESLGIPLTLYDQQDSPGGARQDRESR